MPSQDQAKTKIFVDGNCIVCDLEVSHYKRMSPTLFEIVDISHPDFDPAPYGLTRAAVNLHLHVMTPDGKVEKGVDAFAHIWSRIPRYQFANRVIRLPVVSQLAKAGYAVFVVVRPYLPKKKR
jgi:predicted DCC family thiol-disulfide oxidoreductase YuxK